MSLKWNIATEDYLQLAILNWCSMNSLIGFSTCTIFSTMNRTQYFFHCGKDIYVLYLYSVTAICCIVCVVITINFYYHSWYYLYIFEFILNYLHHPAVCIYSGVLYLMKVYVVLNSLKCVCVLTNNCSTCVIFC